MEKAKKHLKISSLVVLVFVAMSLMEIAAEIFLGDLGSAQIPAGAPDNILQITRTILLVFSVLLLLPKLYVGIKGLRIAKKPNDSKGHIILAIIIFAFSALCLIEPVMNVIKQGSIQDNASAIFGVLLELAIYYDYIMYARAVAKESSKIEA